MRVWIYGRPDKAKYMAMSRDQNSGRSHSIKSDNSYFEKVEKLKKIGKKLHKSKVYSGKN